MSKEDKELLLKDLSARLLYGVICACGFHNGHVQNKKLLKIMSYTTHPYCVELDNDEYMPSAYMLDDIKPYLRPMSSMTDDEIDTYHSYCDCNDKDFNGEVLYFDTIESFDYLNSIHVDFRNLIPKGLALEAPIDMYK